MKYKLIRFEDTTEEDIICVDTDLRDAEKIAFIVGLNLGVIKEEDFLWFGTKDCYSFVSPDEWVIKQEKE